MSTSYPILGRTVAPLPPLPPGLVYWAREIPSLSVEDGRQVVNTYVTTGGFSPDAPDQQRPHLGCVGTLVADFDFADYFFGKVLPPEKADAALAALMRAFPKAKETQLRKVLMYQVARKGPEKMASLRAQHLAYVEEVLARVTPGTVPTVITDSGWGYHFWWWLDQPAMDDATVDAARAENARLVQAINAAAGFSVADDGVHDCGTRILREVGSQNTKDGVGGPRPVTVVRESPDSRWTVGHTDLEDVVPDEASVVDVEGEGGTAPVQEVLFAVPSVLPDAVQAVLSASPKLRDLYAGKGKAAVAPDGRTLDVSGSGYDMSLAVGLVGKGVSPADVAAALYLRNGGRKDLRHCNRTASRASTLAGAGKGTGKTQAKLKAAGAEPAVVKLLACARGGEPRATLANTITVLLHDTRLRDGLMFEERTLEVRFETDRAAAIRTMVSVPARRTLALHDEDFIALRNWVSTVYGFEPSKESAREAAIHVAQRRTRNALAEYLDQAGRDWDHVPRLDTWLRDYAGVDDTPLTRAYARKFLISAVARAYVQRDNPVEGVKIDTVLILKGPQGRGKSTLLRALAGPGGFSDSRFDVNNKDAFVQIRRPWIYECAELSNLNRKEAEDVKAFLTSQSDNFRPPYGTIAIDHPRQGVFVGSTNKDTFLNDPSGSRRYWPVTVGKVDVPGLRAVIDQLWGEAVVAYRLHETWWLGEDREAERAEDAEQYAVEDPQVQQVARWIGTIRNRPFTASEVMTGALGVGASEYDRWKNKVAEWLSALGCARLARTVVDGARVTPWKAPDALYEQALKAAPALPPVEELVSAAAKAPPTVPSSPPPVADLASLQELLAPTAPPVPVPPSPALVAEVVAVLEDVAALPGAPLADVDDAMRAARAGDLGPACALGIQVTPERVRAFGLASERPVGLSAIVRLKREQEAHAAASA